MNIQIFGRSKCFDTKKAERYFKERRIRVQQIDLLRYGMSGGEFDSVLRAVDGVDKLIDWSRRDPDIDLLRYMDDARAKEDKLFERPELMRTPVVRNGRKATVGYCPDCYAAGCASAVLSLALKSAPQTAQRWLLFGGIALLVLGFLVSVTFYRCPHCHRVLPANRGKMDDCPYCKLPLRDTK